MKSPSPLLVKFSGLKEGIHNFNFDIGKKFFESFEYDDFIDVDILTKLKLEKKINMLNLDFFFSGKVKVPCDLTMEPFYIDIKTDYSIIVKFAENKHSTDDKIIFLSTGTSNIDISTIIFETLVLEVPQKRVHPGIKDGSLKSEILDKLEDLKPKELFLNKRDPRWDKLKELL
tara:strand:+ start:53 stop:571 length:519 start_codon:yes stop_codon:yes gene_type:complete